MFHAPNYTAGTQIQTMIHFLCKIVQEKLHHWHTPKDKYLQPGIQACNFGQGREHKSSFFVCGGGRGMQAMGKFLINNILLLDSYTILLSSTPCLQ